MKIDIALTFGNYCVSFFSLRNPHFRIVHGKNGFIQFGKFAFIWGVAH